jgi:TP901 family phage tail tape measure protein
MANGIVDVVIAKTAIDEVERLKLALTNSVAQLDLLAASGAKFGIKANSSTQISTLQKEIEKLKKSLLDVDQVEKDSKATATALEKANAKLANIYSKEAQELIKVRAEITATNAKQRENAKTGLLLDGTYKKLTATYRKLNTAAQDAGAKFGFQSNEFKKASSAALQYRARIDGIDIALKNSQRNVGNYGSALSKTGKVLTSFVGALGITTGIFAFARVMQNTTKIITEFEQQLVAVGKTADLSGEELRRFGDEAIDLVTGRLNKLPLNRILELSETAGQLGIKGSSNILKFAETLAKLETATNIVGQEGATSLARILNLTNESAGSIDQLGSSIVGLGNSFAATEGEIVANATEIAKGIAIYGASSAAISGLGAATVSLGVQSAVAGSSIQKTFIKIDEAVQEGGETLNNFAKIAGVSSEEFAKTFGDDSVEAFRLFINGLGRIKEEGGNVISTVKELGLQDVRLLKTLAPLAGRYDELNRALSLANEEYESNTALNIEAEKAMNTLNGSVTQLSNVWKALVLDVEDGTGVISQAFKAIVDGIAGVVSVIRGINDVSDGFFDFIGNITDAARGLGGVIVAEATLKRELEKTAEIRKELIDLQEADAKAKGLAFFRDVALLRLGRQSNEETQKQIDLLKEKTRAEREANDEGGDEGGTGGRTLSLIKEELKAQKDLLELSTNREQAKAIQNRIRLLEQEIEVILKGNDRVKQEEIYTKFIEEQNVERGISIDSIEKQIDAANKLLKITTSDEERAELVKVVALLKEKLKLLQAGGSGANLDGQLEVNAAMERYLSIIKTTAQVEAQKDKDKLAATENLIEKLELVNEFQNLVADLGIAITERRISKLEEERDEIDETADAQIKAAENEAISEEEKNEKVRLIEEERENKQLIIDKKIAAEKTKAAKIDKAAALANVRIGAVRCSRNNYCRCITSRRNSRATNSKIWGRYQRAIGQRYGRAHWGQGRS